MWACRFQAKINSELVPACLQERNTLNQISIKALNADLNAAMCDYNMIKYNEMLDIAQK